MRETMKEIMAGVAVKEGTRPSKAAYCTYSYTRPDGATAWRYHHTDIVVKHPDGTWTLDSGGWRTSTTKAKINDFSPARLGQHKGEWWLYVGEGQGWSPERIAFVDGIQLDASGQPIGYDRKSAANEVERRAKLAKQINQFCRLLDKAPQEQLIPDAGDCWVCLMFDKPKAPAGKPANVFNCSNDDKHGKPGENVDHLLEHLKEGYVHGSLILNALTWAGYRDPQLILRMSLEPRPGNRDMLKRALRRYLRRRLGLG